MAVGDISVVLLLGLYAWKDQRRLSSHSSHTSQQMGRGGNALCIAVLDSHDGRGVYPITLFSVKGTPMTSVIVFDATSIRLSRNTTTV